MEAAAYRDQSFWHATVPDALEPRAPLALVLAARSRIVGHRRGRAQDPEEALVGADGRVDEEAPVRAVYVAQVGPADDWHGGFFCPCHGSRFDLSGRVYKGVPAPTNLRVPPYRFIREDVIMIGVETGAA